jgi:hypothetical protein
MRLTVNDAAREDIGFYGNPKGLLIDPGWGQRD